MSDSVTYNEGRNLQAGNFFITDQLPLAADTYYIGMRLEYLAAGTAVTTGTGDGVASAIAADETVEAGVYTCLFTAALICDLKDPDGNIIATDLTVPNGGSATFKINGLTFTLTDGATAWIATDTIAMTIAQGVYAALADGELSAIYNGKDGRVLSSAGADNLVIAGDIQEDGLKTDANAAVTLTVAERAAYRSRGFYVK